MSQDRKSHPPIVFAVRSRVVIIPGETRFVFRSPGSGDDWRSNQFFAKYNAKEGLIVSYATKTKAFPPGEFLWEDFGAYGLYVLFDGETEVQFVKSTFIELTSGFSLTSDVPSALRIDQPIASLKDERVFWYDDVVCFADDLLASERRIVSVQADEEGYHTYGIGQSADEVAQVKKTNDEARKDPENFLGFCFSSHWPRVVRSADIRLIARGNFWRLDNAEPDDLVFDSPESERAFWDKLGKSKPNYYRPRPFELALQLLEKGEADGIHHHKNSVPKSWDPYVLPEHRAKFRDRCRMIALAYWHQYAQSLEKT